MSDQPPLPMPLSAELRLQQPALDIRAQFRVLPGRVCALVGRSGSGKTALLQAAAGLRPALGGRVAVGNHPLYDSAAGINLPPHQRRLGWLDAQGHLFPHLNVRRNLAYGLSSAPKSNSDMGFDAVTHWLDLGSLLNAHPDRLTPGQRAKVALGRVLLSSPRALLMDDPLGHVPEPDRAPLIDLLGQVPTRAKVPLVFVSPRMSEVIRMADEVIVLHEGRMASAGMATQILSDVSLSTFLEGVDAGSVVEGEVKHHDINWMLSEVDVGGQRVTVPAVLHGAGRKVRLKIRARDIILQRDLIDGQGVSNQLRGRISQIMLAGENGSYGAVGIELARLRDEGDFSALPAVQLWALLTRRSIQQMGWEPGQPCVASFKAMAVTVSMWR
ncbi:MAG: ATP-binding cassette domain-containing protein [Burkholderiales bacterium]|nr:ATP-binding cassette domain-containing protein [Burkholderiales bacterium]